MVNSEDKSQSPYFKVKENSIVEVDEAFISFSGFAEEDILGKPLHEVWNNKLRINLDPCTIESHKEAILFTKSLEARFVILRSIKSNDVLETKYCFTEIPGSRFEDRNQFLERSIIDNIRQIAVYSVPDFILIKANQGYLDNLPKPYNTKEFALGKPLKNAGSNFESNITEKTLINIVNTNETLYIKERQGLMTGNENIYWDASITPVSENGKIKYLVFIFEDVTDCVISREQIRKQSERIESQKREIELKQTQLTTILDNLNDAVCLFNSEGKVVFANSVAFSNFYKHKFNDPDTAISGYKYYYERGSEIPIENMPITRALQGERIISEIVRAVCCEKEYFVEVSAIPIFNNCGVLDFVITVNRDITEKYLSQREIIYKNNDLEAIIKNVSDVLYVIDKNGKFILQNNAAKKMFNGSTYNNSIYEYSKELGLQDFTSYRVLKGEEIEKQRIIVRNEFGEKQVDVSAVPVFDEKGEFKFGVITGHDITEQKKIEEELIEVNNRLSVALESVGAGILELDVKSGNQIWSPRMYEIYGIDPSEPMPLDKGLATLHPGDREETKRSLEEAYKSRCEFWQHEFRIVNPKRGIIWVNGTAKIIYDKMGNAIKHTGINIDITEQKKAGAEKEQLQKERNEALEASIRLKDEFLYLITHEFKTPMAVVNSALQAIELIYKKDVTENVGRYLKTIKQNTNRQLRLVNNLLDITRINSGNIKLNRGNFDIVYVTKAIVHSVSIYANQKRISLSFISDIAKKVVYLDEEKYERILLNLLANAVKFTPYGKNISVSLSIRMKRNRNMICVSVTDEGIGIPKDKQKVIFERFGQVDSSLSRQAEGTGLGLHLVKLFVNALNGEITLRSKEDEGSTFTVIFPDVKVTALEELAASVEVSNQSMINDNRIIQAASVEFSDIYFD